MLTGTPYKLRSGDWGARVRGAAKPGDAITIQTKGGKSWTATVTKVVWSGEGVTLCALNERSKSKRGATSSRYECKRCGCTDPTCGGRPAQICRGPDFDPCFDCV